MRIIAFSAMPLSGGLNPVPKNRVENKIGLERLLDLRLAEIFFVSDPQRRHGKLLEHFSGVAAQLVRSFGQHDYGNFLSRVMQLARGNKAIAAVVAFAADGAHRVEVEMLLRKFGHGRACVFHQGKRRNAVFLSGGAVNGAHLFRGNDFHERVAEALAARDSSRASCAVSPMAIRQSSAPIISWAWGLNRVLPSARRMASTMIPSLW